MAVPPTSDVVAQQFEVMEAVNAPLSAWETFSQDLSATLAQHPERESEIQPWLARVNAKIATLKTP